MKGYKQGRSKRALLEAVRLGLTRQEVLRRNPWMTEPSLISVCSRNGIILESEKRPRPAKRGSVKDAAIAAHDGGLTVREAVTKFGVNESSLLSIARDMGMKLKR